MDTPASHVAAPSLLRVNGYDMAYVAAGAGRPLLLVHGSLCDCRYWRPQMAPLAAGRHVIALSLRHYWPEAWDGSGAGFSVQQHADDVAAFIAALDAGPVDLVGHSRGGTVAWMLAWQRPALLRSLVLADPALALGEAQMDLDRGGFRRRALALIRGGDADAGLALFIDTVSGAGTWEHMVPGLRRMMRDNANTLIGQAVEPAETVSTAAAQSLRLPLLLVGGAHSPAPYPAILQALAALLPGAEHATIPGASHAMNLWNAPAFNRALESFLPAA